MDNRRKDKRFDAAVAAEVELDGQTYEGETRDISIGGVSVLIDEPVDEGAKLAITLILTEDGIESASEEALTAQAQVMWAAPTDDGTCMLGLRFNALASTQSQRLQRFLAALAENHAPR